ncbi:MAG: hypothetical protein WAU60_18035, partial [Candidatus Competibacter denitrificans]
MMRVTATRPSGRSIATAAVLTVGLLFGLSATAMAQGPGPQRTAPPEMANLPPPEQATPPGGAVAQPMATLTVQVPVTSNMSLVHVGSSDSFAITPEGRQAATDLFEALGAAERQETAKMTEKAKSALAIYAKIIPRENYGGEYTALQWFADYLLADNAKKAEMTTEPLTNEFFKMFGGNNYQVLKE